MLPWLGEFAGNPHSSHSWGTNALEAVENARYQVANLIGAEDASQIIFTSGATEASNTIVHLLDPSHTQVSPHEHSAVRVPATHPNRSIPVSTEQNGKNQLLIACSNETGAVYDTKNPWFADVTQTIGKCPFDFSRTKAAWFSAHKFHGPPGVGVLYLEDPTMLNEDCAFIAGGGQEQGRRAGSLNVAGIIATATALNLSISRQTQNSELFRELRQILRTSLPNLTENRGAVQCPAILSLTVPGIVAQNLVTEVDRLGFAISSGSACSSANPEPSPALLALGLSESEATSTIRISFACQNTPESTNSLSDAIKTAINCLRP